MRLALQHLRDDDEVGERSSPDGFNGLDLKARAR